MQTEPLRADADPPRTVKPRKHSTSVLPIIALSHDTALHETGLLISHDELLQDFAQMPAHIFVRQGVADWVAELDYRFSHLPDWQWRAGEHERTIARPDGTEIASRLSTVIHFFGFKGRFHLALDPLTFYGRSFDAVWNTDDSTIDRLMKWALRLREWCADNGLPVKPTNGAIGAALLRDPRFYPDDRRKVPRVINERCREQLPGNYYQLFARATPDSDFTATYLDQKRAHHYHAEHTTLPNSNSLYAYGDFRDLGAVSFDAMRPGFVGLLCCVLRVPKNPSLFIPPAFTRKGPHFVWTNELPYLSDMGLAVEGVIAAWGSYEHDRGLQRYARWSQQQLDRYEDAPWLKPLLLSTYGILAVRPREPAFVFKRAAHGTPVQLMTGHYRLHGELVKATNGRKIESNIANVLHRAMIEASTRCESLGLAHYLFHKGFRILSIYADAVIVENDGETPLPFIPDPWREKETLHHLRFINTQAFVSGEMTKLPGVAGRDLLKYHGPAQPLPHKVMFNPLTGNQFRHETRHI